MWRGFAVLVLAASGSVGAGCGDSPPPASIESFCDGFCRGVVRCQGGSRSACESDCLGYPGNWQLTSIRREVAAVVGTCLAAESSCDTILNGPHDACWDRARAEVAPTAHLLDFCPAYATWAFNCGYSYPVEDCRLDMNIWTDDFLDSLTACTQQATCAATDACLEARFGDS
jgi:hypothetical protein